MRPPPASRNPAAFATSSELPPPTPHERIGAEGARRLHRPAGVGLGGVFSEVAEEPRRHPGGLEARDRPLRNPGGHDSRVGGHERALEPHRARHRAERADRPRARHDLGRRAVGEPPVSSPLTKSRGVRAGDASRPNPRPSGALIVAFRSEYSRYSSLTRLVDRAPHRSRRCTRLRQRTAPPNVAGIAGGRKPAQGPVAPCSMANNWLRLAM